MATKVTRRKTTRQMGARKTARPLSALESPATTKYTKKRIQNVNVNKTENERLTRVGRGTPMGELLRRYWLPIGVSSDLKEKPTFVRVLGEDLVLFRGKGGQTGLLGATCPHRHANLCLGNVVGDDLRCRYHGYTWSPEGKLVYVPKEEPDSSYLDSVTHLAYPTQELGGLVFAYLGPQPAPLLPRYQFIAGEGEHFAKITGISNCNWLQCVENGMDPMHVSYTHGDVWDDLEAEPGIAFEETPWGLVHKAFRPGREPGKVNYREHHLLFPGISCVGSPGRVLEGSSGTPVISARWSVPIDDTHTLIIRCTHKAADNPGRFTRDPIAPAWKGVPVEPYKEYKNRNEDGTVTIGYTIPGVIATEDATLIDSLGPIVERSQEHLHPFGDFGMVTMRRMYLREIAKVRAGRDPIGTVRDSAKDALIVVPAYERWITEEDRQRMRAQSRPIKI
ncbi:MAG: Rieske 2Fe-2S domain-containing protein [Armatimonadota bacterium]